VSQDFSGMADERGQQPVFDWREVYLLLSDDHLSLGEIHLQAAYGERGFAGIVRVASRVTEGRPHAGKQFPHPEWLAHVVVGTSIEGGDFVPFLTSRRQHNDWQGSPFAEPPDDIEPIYVGQAEIENHNVGLARCRFNEAGLPRGGLVQTVSMRPQGCPEEAQDLWIVFDDKDDGSPAGRSGCIRGLRSLGSETRFKQFQASPVARLWPAA